MLIQDIKPYPSRLQALSQAFLGELVSLRGKRINVTYIKPVKLTRATDFPNYRAFVYQPTEDDYIQDQAFEMAEYAREYETEMLRGENEY